MNIKLLNKYPVLKDVFGVAFFIAAVFLGTVIINSFIFRSFNVEGPSMEETLHTNDRLIVSKLATTWANITGKDYIPKRGEVIVFENPKFHSGYENRFVVKRVIAFAGERVVVKNGSVTVYNDQYPGGFNPDVDYASEAKDNTSGNSDTTVADDTIFVMGDNREGNFSCDSRSCMGTIPLEDIIGPVTFRIYPFTKIRSF